MDERIEKWLNDILIAIDDIDGFVGHGPRRFADFVGNRMLRVEVERFISRNPD